MSKKIVSIKEEKTITKAIKEGKIIIYPTDTVYGIGCNAKNSEAVKKLRKIKKSNKPFSIIAPSKKWIEKNFKIKKIHLQKLPGPYTYILKTKKKGIVCKETNLGRETIGVRIPKHPITKILQKTKQPIITTSANLSGKKTITNPKKIPWRLKRKVDMIIDDGILGEKPSTIIDLTSETPKIIKRQK